ncbi:MAG: glycosyltransferase family 39 protein [Actinocatenispora sp.]
MLPRSAGDEAPTRAGTGSPPQRGADEEPTTDWRSGDQSTPDSNRDPDATELHSTVSDQSDAESDDTDQHDELMVRRPRSPLPIPSSGRASVPVRSTGVRVPGVGSASVAGQSHGFATDYPTEERPLDERLREERLRDGRSGAEHAGPDVDPERPRTIVGTAIVADGFRGTDRALTQLAWLGAALLTAVVGIFRADRPSLWADELATWGMTTVPWHSMWGLLQSTDMVNGPYYALMRAWVQIAGDSDLALRLPSLIAMTIAAALVAALGSRFGGPRVGLMAGLLFAVVPATSRYGQEARGYAIVLCLATLATLLLARALDRPRFVRFLPYVLVLALMGMFSVISLVLLVAHGLMVLALRRGAVWGWLAASVFGALPGIVLLMESTGQRGQVSWIAPATLRSLAGFPNELFGMTAIGGCLAVLAALAVSYRHPAIVYTAWAMVPAVVLFAVGHYTSVWLPRYLLFTLPAWVLLAAITLDRVPLVRGLLVVAAVALVSVPAQMTFREPTGHTQDTRAVATIIANNEQPGDGIIYGTEDPGGAWVGRDIVTHYLAPGSRPKDLLVVQQPRSNGKVLAIECKDASKCLGSSTSRIWIVRLGTVKDPLHDLGGTKEAALRTSFQLSKTWRPTGMTLAVLTRKPS